MNQLYKVNHGGLMRCCLKSLDDAMLEAKEYPKEGDTLKCKYCSDDYGMIFTNDSWKWNKPKESKQK